MHGVCSDHQVPQAQTSENQWQATAQIKVDPCLGTRRVSYRVGDLEMLLGYQLGLPRAKHQCFQVLRANLF